MGVLAAIINVKNGGKGQVIDVAMSDGAASLTAMFWGMRAMGVWTDDREANMLDGGAHFYDTYETKDGKWISLGSIEPQFYALLLEKTGLKGQDLPAQHDRAKWPEMKAKFTEIFKTKTRDEWCAIMEGTDICFAPVLTMSEAPDHAHAKARNGYVDVAGFKQPAPAPRFSRTPGSVKGPAPRRGEHTEAVLNESGFSAGEIKELAASGVIALGS